VLTGKAKPSALLSSSSQVIKRFTWIAMELNLGLHVEKLSPAAQVFAWSLMSQREINVIEQVMKKDPELKGFLGVNLRAFFSSFSTNC